jgi:hypothetical protein
MSTKDMLVTPHFVTVGPFAQKLKGRTNMDCMIMEPIFFLKEGKWTAKSMLVMPTLNIVKNLILGNIFERNITVHTKSLCNEREYASLDKEMLL